MTVGPYALRLSAPWLAVVITIALAACGGSGANTTTKQGATATPTSAPVAAAPPGGVGVYTRKRTSPGFPDTSTLALYADGRYTQDVGSGITGRWAFADGKITFSDAIDINGGGCPGANGIYTWSYDGTHLTLILVSDPCHDRAVDLPVAPWSKVPWRASG